MKKLSGKNWVRILPALAVLFLVSCTSNSPPEPVDSVERTSARTPSGREFYPQDFFAKKPYAEFLPGESNWDAQHRHPDQWLGQDWDPSMWNKNWTPEQAVHYFYQSRILQAQVMEKNTPVLVLGPTFYKISDLDRRRVLKLVTDTSKIFDKGFTVVVLRDWYDGKTIGNYTPKGMYLN